MKEHIAITCYGRKEIWTDRNKALQFYLNGIAATDGSEKDRYMNIYIDLLSGKTHCYDKLQDEYK